MAMADWARTRVRRRHPTRAGRSLHPVL